MNRLATYIATFVMAISLTVISISSSYAETFQEGQNYIPITPAQPTNSKDKVEVVEMFWYGCPHCYRLEPYVKRWLKTKPDNVNFIRMPGVLNPGWELLARAYYTAEILASREIEITSIVDFPTIACQSEEPEILPLNLPFKLKTNLSKMLGNDF